jgi:hypothetical protein
MPLLVDLRYPPNPGLKDQRNSGYQQNVSSHLML